jgi:hypothetical protein
MMRGSGRVAAHLLCLVILCRYQSVPSKARKSLDKPMGVPLLSQLSTDLYNLTLLVLGSQNRSTWIELFHA